MRAAVVLCVAAGWMWAAVQAGAFELGARVAYWYPALSGDVRLDDGVRGDRVSWTDDLGVDDEGIFFGDAWVWLGDHQLILSAARVEYSGSKNLGGVTFGGKTFSGDTDASLEYTSIDLAYRYDLIDLENILAGFSLGPIVQVKYLDGEARLEGGGQEASQSFQVPVPMVGAGLHVGILADMLEVRIRGAGMGFRGNVIWEALGEVSFNPLPFVEIVGGYRHFSLDVDEDDLVLDYTQSGPYVGLGLKL